jgi:hypothetical protein
MARIVKRTGDGSSVEFRGVVDAARCAIEMQGGMIERVGSYETATRLRKMPIPADVIRSGLGKTVVHRGQRGTTALAGSVSGCLIKSVKRAG